MRNAISELLVPGKGVRRWVSRSLSQVASVSSPRPVHLSDIAAIYTTVLIFIDLLRSYSENCHFVSNCLLDNAFGPDSSVASDTSGHSFCGDIDGVPLGQRGVLPGPTQINSRAFRGGNVVGCSTRPMLPGARLLAPKHFAIITHPQLP
ncbi:unnamed protein product [Colias eurytheme]|nr:unnamed protein product [Colias eurytheme]